MKKILYVTFLLIGVFSLRGQEDPKNVLDNMSEVYKAMAGYEISFVQKVLSESEVIDRQTGQAFVSNEKFIIKFQEQHIYCNGPVIWTYLVESQELTINNFDASESEIDPTNIYDIYKEGFTYEYLRQDDVNGQLVHVVELKATDEDADFTNIIMYIGQEDSYLKGWDLIDYAGAKTAFEVSAFKPDQSYSETFFEFDEDANPVEHKEDLRN